MGVDVAVNLLGFVAYELGKGFLEVAAKHCVELTFGVEEGEELLEELVLVVLEHSDLHLGHLSRGGCRDFVLFLIIQRGVGILTKVYLVCRSGLRLGLHLSSSSFLIV